MLAYSLPCIEQVAVEVTMIIPQERRGKWHVSHGVLDLLASVRFPGGARSGRVI